MWSLVYNSYMQEIQNFIENVSVPINYIQAGGIIALAFLLIVLLGFVGQYMNKSTLKGMVVGTFFGVFLAIIIEGFLLIAGRTALTELMGWKNAPKPVQTALDTGREKLINVLGVADEIPSMYAKNEIDIDDAVEVLQSLNPDQMKRLKSIICTP